jgi:4'-phosphopantetheinyl transferase EntD
LKASTPSPFRVNPAQLCASTQELFPVGVIAAEMREPGSAADLWPAEAECVRRAVSKRVLEFAAGRACARRALHELGIDDFVLLAAEDRQPLWPPTIVGSITHTEGFCAAVVAPRTLLAGVGIDSEQVRKVTGDLWPTICRPEEASWCRSLPEQQQTPAAAMLFAAKEAFYKCQYPLTGEWLDFHDLAVEAPKWGTARGEFCVRAVRPVAAEAFFRPPLYGRYRFHDSWVTAAVAFAA